MDQMNPLSNPHMDMDMDMDMDLDIGAPPPTLPSMGIAATPPPSPPKVVIHDDHEIEMAKAQCYKAAKNAMEIHKLLKMVDNLEGWMQAKITLAADYLEAVASNLEYDVVASTMMESQMVAEEKYEVSAKDKKVADFGRKMMDHAEKAKFKAEPGMSKKEKAAAEAEHDALMNKFSRVGEKMTHINTLFGPKGLTAAEKEVVAKARKMLAEAADLKKKRSV